MIRVLFKTVYYLVFLAIVSVTGLLLVSLFPIQDNYQVKVVLSGSMEPAIQTGSIVVIKAADAYKVGDVITFGKDTSRDVPVTHRVIEIQEEAGAIVFQTKGDANNSIDPQTVAPESVIGKVLFDVPYVGFVVDFAKQPIGFMALVIIPALIIGIGELAKITLEIYRIYRRKHIARNEVHT